MHFCGIRLAYTRWKLLENFLSLSLFLKKNLVKPAVKKDSEILLAAEKIEKKLLLEFIHRMLVIHSEFLVNKYPEFAGDTIPLSCLLFPPTFSLPFH